MLTVAVPETGTAASWRASARACLSAGLTPGDILWQFGAAPGDLFEETGALPEGAPPPRVPRKFVELAESVCWHEDPERFARLYAFLWALTQGGARMDDAGDPRLAALRAMEKAVHRCQHKMKAFVRFREIPAADTPNGGSRRRFATWFEPTHNTLEPTAPFFARRFGDMDWAIATPGLTAVFEDGALRFEAGQAKPPLPDDATEALWATYFGSIFNPARVKLKAMIAEMPKKYWRNLPETRRIPELLAGAESQVREMQAAAPSLPPPRAERIAAKLHAPTGCAAGGAPHPEFERPESLAALSAQLGGCTRCPLHGPATQAVPGEGPEDAGLLIVGEQPGDEEDLAGRPFVGPAGRLFDEVAASAGLDRSTAYVTNAVKHFKYEPRGKKRLHQRPNAGEVAHCKWWLGLERQIVRPRLILAMGATAAEALTGNGNGILRRRGTVEKPDDGPPVLLTTHPSYLLRLPDVAARRTETGKFRRDLEQASWILAGGRA